MQATFSDDPALLDAGAVEMLPGVVVTDDEFNRTTVAQVTSEHGRTQTATADAATLAQLGRRNSIQLSSLLHSSDAQSLAIAQWLILAYSTPRPRVETVSFVVESDPEQVVDNGMTLAEFAQKVDHGWLVRVKKTAPVGPDVDVQGHVVGIELSWSAAGLRVTLALDGSRTGWSWFTWGSSTWDNAVGQGWAF